MSEKPTYRFAGFESPNYTPVPDALFDELAPNLTEAELRVLLYIVRRTFGFKREADAISLSQLVSGITTKDGRVLDRGTGMSRPGVAKGVKGLVDKGVISVERVMDERGENQVNTYRLRFRGTPATSEVSEGVVNDVDHRRQPRFAQVGNEVNPQETEQETEEQHFESSKAPTILERYDETRVVLLAYAEDLAREFRDEAPLSSTTTRLVNLYRAAGVDLETFVDRMMQARAVTQERTSSIRKRADDGRGLAQKMPYFLAVLQDLLGQRDEASRNAGD